MNIEVESYQAWFRVDTKHGAKLEFVLIDEAERNTFERSFYVDQLSDMLSESRVPIVESMSYGDISFQISAASPNELQQELERCDIVVAQWKYRCGVDRMKDSR